MLPEKLTREKALLEYLDEHHRKQIEAGIVAEDARDSAYPF